MWQQKCVATPSSQITDVISEPSLESDFRSPVNHSNHVDIEWSVPSAVERSCQHLEQFEMRIVGAPSLNGCVDQRVAKDVSVSGSGSGGLLRRWNVVLHCGSYPFARVCNFGLMIVMLKQRLERNVLREERSKDASNIVISKRQSKYKNDKDRDE